MRTGKFALGIAVSLVVFLLGVYFFLPSFSRAALSSHLSTTLTVISDDVFVKKGDSGNWEKIAKEASLEEGNWVKTSSEGRAVITFFEGSSTEVEPNTIISLQEIVAASNGSTTISLNQPVGRTWNRVEKLFDPASRFEVETSAAAAVARGTLFVVDAADDGTTEVMVFDGQVGTTAQGQEVNVSAGWQTTVNPGEPPSPSSQMPPPSSQLTISVGSPAWLDVVDPLGRSAGIIPPGVDVNQIPLSNTSAVDGKQVVSINEPISGTYYLSIYGYDKGSIQLAAKGTSQSGFNQEESRQFEVEKGQGYYARLDLNVDEQGFIVSFSLSEVRPQNGQINTITASAGENGSISPSGSVWVDYGADQSFTITASTGYSVADVLVDGVSVGAVTSYSFTNVTADHSISASFAIINTYTITPSEGENYSWVSSSGSVSVNHGANQTYTITVTPSTGYHVVDVLVDGVSVGAVTSYSFTDVTGADHTVSVSFAVNTLG
jgi:hypothetical protein